MSPPFTRGAYRTHVRYRLLSLSQDGFSVFLKSLELKNETIASLSVAANEAVMALFAGDLDSSRRLALEDENPEHILAEPDSSLRLVRFLEWQK